MQFLWHTKLLRCSVQWLTVFSTATNSPHPAPECGKEWAEQRYTAQRPAERDWELRVETGVCWGWLDGVEAVTGPRLWRRMESTSGRGWAPSRATLGAEPRAGSSVHTCRVATTHHPHPPPRRLGSLMVFSSFDNILRNCPLAPSPSSKRPQALESKTIKNLLTIFTILF